MHTQPPGLFSLGAISPLHAKKSNLHERFLSSRKADYSVFVPASGNFSRGVHDFSFFVIFLIVCAANAIALAQYLDGRVPEVRGSGELPCQGQASVAVE